MFKTTCYIVQWLSGRNTSWRFNSSRSFACKFIALKWQIVNFKTNCVFSQEEFCHLYTVCIQHSSFIHCVRLKIPNSITHAQLQSGHGGILMCNYARLYCTLMMAEFSLNCTLFFVCELWTLLQKITVVAVVIVSECSLTNYSCYWRPCMPF